MVKTDFRLADYLRPRGTRPYESLAPDLEAALARGETVYLWSVPNMFMLSGHPDPNNYGKKWRPWSDGYNHYKTAKDCLNGKRGKSML